MTNSTSAGNNHSVPRSATLTAGTAASAEAAAAAAAAAG
eukprot:CAMPEP_0179898758 /NCGR_PEP_ID=MMETSP0982-20121206/37859_1 /TAXON_ID=483367 /ORGANISM="non described non described, Strain CCMP 2436" /LENGTH=38 /DNA_ID= /DNA_START= /DNA_END= /DNA_ORIENTATION=